MTISPDTTLSGLGVGPLEVRSSSPGIVVPPAVQAVVFQSNALERGSEVGAGFAAGTDPHFTATDAFTDASITDPALTNDQLGFA